MGGILIPFHSVNDEAAHGPCVSSLVPITVDGIGFLLPRGGVGSLYNYYKSQPIAHVMQPCDTRRDSPKA